jgi:hypothetical protein
MKKIMKTNREKSHLSILKKIMSVLMLSVLLMACNTSDNEKSATLHVRLTDAPADFDEVNIDIQGVLVHSKEGVQESGWIALNVENGVYNLLELSNGLDTLLGVVELPAGKISQIRLLLGNNNTVMVNGELFPLATPSAQQSGLKLNVNAQLKAGVTYTILLDFDAALSVVEKGNGTYSLKPVIRAISEATSGAISGIVSPVLADPVIYVIQVSDTVATAFTDEAGNFLVRGVPAGTYTVSFSPKDGYIPMQFNSVNVTLGNVTSLGTVVIL